jgi:hypothetical protein
MSSHPVTCREFANQVAPEYRLAPDVLLVPVEDGSARLIDFSGKTFALSDVAARMLSETLSLGTAQAAANCARHWGVDHEHVAGDLDKFLAGLVGVRLLVPAGLEYARRGSAEGLAGWAVSIAARLACLLRPSATGKASGLLTVAKLSCRWLGWAQTVRVWQRTFPRSACPLGESAAANARDVVDSAVRQALSRAAMHHACKERVLTGWALARRAGLCPSLVIGISLFPLHAHCWAQLGDTYLGDTAERCLQYTAVQVYE